MTLETFEKGIDEYVKTLENNEYSVNTVKKYSLALRNFIAFAEVNGYCDIIYKDCFLEYKEYIKDKYAPNTVNLYLIALNKYLRYKDEDELCVKTIKIQSHNCLENCLTIEEFLLMLNVAKNCKNDKIYYILRVLTCTGVRFKGLEYFTAESVRKGSITVTNKGKTRVIVIPPSLCKELISYCKSKDLETGYIFHSRDKSKPVCEFTVLRWMKKVAVKAGVDPQKVFPHNLRHLFARTYMEVLNNLDELADILGHTKIETTRIYTRTSIEEKRRNLAMIENYFSLR